MPDKVTNAAAVMDDNGTGQGGVQAQGKATRKTPGWMMDDRPLFCPIPLAPSGQKASHTPCQGICATLVIPFPLAPTMLDLSSISLLCLDTRHPDLALMAMQRCLASARFHEAVLLTREDYVSPDPRICAQGIPPLRHVADYSRFMVKALGAHFSGEQVLVVQWDSFIIEPGAWDPAFLAYDYIGAPWPHKAQPVGNGGFSLRSRKLVDALQDPEIRECQPEDYAICELYHELLARRHGIRFAPQALADRFAFELAAPAQPTFGFHGLFNFHRALPEAELMAWLEQAPPGPLLSMQGRRLLKNLIATGRHREARFLLDIRNQGGLGRRLDTLKLRARLALGRLKG